MELERLIENFECFDDWEDRYAYLIDLGRKLPDLADTDKTAQNKVEGCISQVWMIGSLSETTPPKLELQADSDAHIVRGLIAILLAAFSGKTPAEIAGIDIKAIFAQLGLEEHLSFNRRNGFYAMVQRIHLLAGAM